ncbi:MAG: yfkO [Patescibacteria group bacterium]|nr:yfkO [Patescibacteria group bacterium]
MSWRYAVKKYDTEKKLTSEQLNLAKESLRLSPSSTGVEAWKFIHVTNPETRAKLREAAYGQSPITDASDLFILAPHKTIDGAFVDTKMNDIATLREMPVENLKGYSDMLNGVIAAHGENLSHWLAHQVYIALGVAIANLAANQIDATPMEGFDSQKFDEILGLSELGLHAQVILAIGFRADDDQHATLPKYRRDAKDIFIER